MSTVKKAASTATARSCGFDVPTVGRPLRHRRVARTHMSTAATAEPDDAPRLKTFSGSPAASLASQTWQPRTSRHLPPCQAASGTNTSMLDYVLGQGTYQLLTGVFGLLVGTAFVTTATVAMNFMGVSLIQTSELFCRAAGANLFIPIAMAFSLQAAVANNRLDSPTYKRMSFGLALTFLVICAIKYYRISKGYEMPAAALWLTNVMQILPTVAFIKLYGVNSLSGVFPGFLSGIQSVFQPRNWKSGLYSLLTVLTMLIAVIGVTTPKAFLDTAAAASVDQFSLMYVQVFSALTFLLSIACFSLKDAADRARLGFSTFQRLNIAACLLSVAQIGCATYLYRTAGEVIQPFILYEGGWIVGLILYSVLGLLSGYNAITAKRE